MNTAIISGASVGIGAAAAARFIADGYRVFNLSRRVCPVDGVTSIPCDLSDRLFAPVGLRLAILFWQICPKDA